MLKILEKIWLLYCYYKRIKNKIDCSYEIERGYWRRSTIIYDLQLSKIPLKSFSFQFEKENIDLIFRNINSKMEYKSFTFYLIKMMYTNLIQMYFYLIKGNSNFNQVKSNLFHDIYT